MGDSATAAKLNDKDQGILAWASKFVSDVGDFFVEAGGGNTKKLNVGPGDVKPVKIEFPTFPSGAIMQKLAGKYNAKDQPVAKAIVDGMPHLDFTIRYDVPKAVAEQVSEPVAREKLLEWLQPILAGLEASLEQIVENRQSDYEQLDSAEEKAKMLAGIAEYAQALGDDFLGGIRKNLIQEGKTRLVAIYTRLGAHVDANGVGNWNFTYKIGTGTVKFAGGVAGLAASGVTAGVSGVAGVVAVVDAAAGIANAIAERLTVIESVEHDVEAELNTLLTSIGANGQGLKDLISSTVRAAASVSGFGMDNITDLARNLVRAGNNMGPLGDGIKKAFDKVTGTTESVENRLTLLQQKCGGVAKDSNGFYNQLDDLLEEAKKTGQQDAIPGVEDLIKKVTDLNQIVMRVDEQIRDSQERLEAFKASLGKWQTAKKFVDVAGAMVQLGMGLNDAAAVKSWQDLQDALSDEKILETVGKVIDIKEAASAVKEGLAG